MKYKKVKGDKSYFTLKSSKLSNFRHKRFLTVWCEQRQNVVELLKWLPLCLEVLEKSRRVTGLLVHDAAPPFVLFKNH